MELKLEEWQSLTVESLAEERNRLAKRIQGINDALQHYTETWGNGKGSFVFNQRSDGLYLVRVDDETRLAPAD